MSSIHHNKLLDLKVSVVIPTYQREDVLCETIKQLLCQDRPADEILVVDQTVEHKSETFEFLHHCNGEGKIRWIHQEVPNLPRARNRGILGAKGDIIVFLDDDVIIGPDFIRSHLANYLDDNIVGVGGQRRGEGGSFWGLTDEIPPEVYRNPFGWMKFPPNFSIRTKRIWMAGGNCSVRKWAAIKIGGFDENFVGAAYYEDFDFSWKIHKKINSGVVHDPRAWIYHLKAESGGCRIKRPKWHLPEIEELQPRFYFRMKNFPIYSIPQILRFFRAWVLNKGNLFKPYYLPIALFRFFVALSRAAYLATFRRDVSIINGLKKFRRVHDKVHELGINDGFVRSH